MSSQPDPIPFDSSSEVPPADTAGVFVEPRSGMLCPRCRKARLDYNGMIELECPSCGFVINSGAPCS